MPASTRIVFGHSFLAVRPEAEGPGRPQPLLVCTGQTLTIPLGSMTYLRAAPLSKSW
jgi:hypothetical protein